MCKKMIVVFLSAIFLLSVGCAKHMHKSEEMTQMESEMQEKESSIAALESSIEQKTRDLAQFKEELAMQKMKSREAESMALSARSTMSAEGDLFPPNAKTGECFTRVFVPPTYETVTEQVVKRGESERLEVVPAQFEWVEEQVLVQEASERLEVIPPQYDVVQEQVLESEASSRIEQLPAEFDWVEENVLVKEAHTTWKKGSGPIQKVDNTTGEIMCLVEVPASHKVVKRKVMTKAPGTRMVEIPASYKTVEKKIVVQPATTRTVSIPAEYKTVKVRKMVAAPQEKKIFIPAEYETVSRTVKTSEGSMEWRRILCETNVNAGTILKIQRALFEAGFDPGPLDGVLGQQTMKALSNFQKEKGLPSGEITYESMEQLGIIPSPAG